MHQQFQQLQTVEETSWETPACNLKERESREMQERREENYQVNHPGLYLVIDFYILQDLVNKSDSEKVLARRLGLGAEELERMVTARGREV